MTLNSKSTFKLFGLFHIQGKQKAEKNRQKAEEVFLKSAHAQRQEAAQLRREEKRRAEKERIMNEEDPDKARKWEVKYFTVLSYL
jgi:hypothetical protein